MFSYNPPYQYKEREIDNMNNNNQNHYSNNNKNSLLNEVNELKNIKERVSYLENNELKLNKLEENIKNNEEKLSEINKSMNDLKKLKNEENNNTKSFISQSMELEKLAQENLTLKADTIIYREDINHLYEINKKLEKELETCRKKMIELINNNNSYEKEIINKNLQVEQLSETITRLRLFDNPEVDFTIDYKKNKDQKIQELVFNNQNLNDDNIKLIMENKFLNERLMNEIKDKEDLGKDLNYSKLRENEQISLLENKIQNLENQLNTISKENMTLRMNDEKNLRELNILKKEKDNFSDKLKKKKEQLNQLSNKYKLLEEKSRQLELEKQINQDSIKKINNTKNNNNKIFNDLYNKIQLYKSQIHNQRPIGLSQNSLNFSEN